MGCEARKRGTGQAEMKRDTELDFIVNYDIKYRMGLGGDEEDEG